MNRSYLIIFISVLLVSCGIQKRHYNKGFYFSHSSNSHGSKAIADSDKSLEIFSSSSEKHPDEIDVVSNEDYSLTPDFGDTNKCDKILFRDADEVECIVKEVSNNEIKYKKCGFEDGPLYTVESNSVSAILYRNGTKEFYGNYVKPEKTKNSEESDDYINGYTTWASDPRDIEIFSVLSLIFSTIYFIPGLSIVFGLIGLRMFKKEPGRYKGKGFAYAGIIMGSLALLLLILIFII
ncbi:MAG: DUF4190 domain-containing protein [Flavobacteriales bacterium]|nr:DUF4190 domain-containing protein [Flavobacteriales bacterium]